nr:HTH domain-containing protein [Photobacterium leiognathi]
MHFIYRDIATLQAQGADIEGETGLGYILKPKGLIVVYRQ